MSHTKHLNFKRYEYKQQGNEFISGVLQRPRIALPNSAIMIFDHPCILL